MFNKQKGKFREDHKISFWSNWLHTVIRLLILKSTLKHLPKQPLLSHGNIFTINDFVQYI